MRFKCVVEYDGTDYHGWQIQPNGRTIQAVLEDALRRLAGEPVRVAAAGRTDAGVHARAQVVSFVLARRLAAPTLLRALNALTPRDVAVSAVEPAPDDFDPRRAARSRVYTYRIWNAPWISPFWRRYAWHVPQPLDAGRMHAAAALLLGEHDFSAFRAAGCDADTPVRRVLRSEIARDAALITYTIEATAFLRHMVRTIVGTLAQVGAGERAAADVPVLLAARDRTRSGPTAPACGLCLTRVIYAGGASACLAATAEGR
jgi:tRNA pseudouridine38-40 synthase